MTVCMAGVVLCSEIARSYLVNYARSLIYTTSAPFTSLLSIDIAYDYVGSAEANARREHLRELIRYTHQSLLDLCAGQSSQSSETLIRVRRRPPVSPIIPVLTAYPRNLAAYCQTNGYMIRPIVPPTVPPGSERVRICLHAENTVSQVNGLCRTIDRWLRHQRPGLEQDAQKPMEHQAHGSSQTQPSNTDKAKI